MIENILAILQRKSVVFNIDKMFKYFCNILCATRESFPILPENSTSINKYFLISKHFSLLNNRKYYLLYDFFNISLERGFVCPGFTNFTKMLVSFLSISTKFPNF